MDVQNLKGVSRDMRLKRNPCYNEYLTSFQTSLTQQLSLDSNQNNTFTLAIEICRHENKVYLPKDHRSRIQNFLKSLINIGWHRLCRRLGHGHDHGHGHGLLRLNLL
ncbi:hypothetical protein V1477_001609 [Vespula maculifrons]|uniref:Uncharacterized protein n=1 Tax=Vespula maculifrons TaxID=7453 RepID=A0ABD2CYA5_VESMC